MNSTWIALTVDVGGEVLIKVESIEMIQDLGDRRVIHRSGASWNITVKATVNEILTVMGLMDNV